MLVVVETQDAGEGGRNGRGRGRLDAVLLQTGVVVGTDRGRLGHFLPAQTRNPSWRSAVGQPYGAGAELGAPGLEELLRLIEVCIAGRALQPRTGRTRRERESFRPGCFDPGRDLSSLWVHARMRVAMARPTEMLHVSTSSTPARSRPVELCTALCSSVRLRSVPCRRPSFRILRYVGGRTRRGNDSPPPETLANTDPGGRLPPRFARYSFGSPILRVATIRVATKGRTVPDSGVSVQPSPSVAASVGTGPATRRCTTVPRGENR